MYDDHRRSESRRASEPEHPYERLTFEWVPLGSTSTLNLMPFKSLPPAVASAEIERRLDIEGEQMVQALRTYVLAKKLPGHTVGKRLTVRWRVPASWWQHFKQQHAATLWLAWLVRLRPVREVTRARSVDFRATWSDMVTYPWQTVVQHENLGPGIRDVQLDLTHSLLPWWRP